MAFKMQAILVLKVRGFKDLVRDLGIREATDMVYDFRDVAISQLGTKISIVCYDMVVATLPSVRDALDQAKHIMNTICTQNTLGILPTGDTRACIPIGAAAGYGDLYQTVDGSYWGIEMSNTISLVEDAAPNNILLTDMARSQISYDVLHSCPI